MQRGALAVGLLLVVLVGASVAGEALPAPRGFTGSFPEGRHGLPGLAPYERGPALVAVGERAAPSGHGLPDFRRGGVPALTQGGFARYER